MDETTKKAIWILERENGYSGYVRAKIDEMKAKFVAEVEEAVEQSLKDAKVHRLILENLNRIPVLIRTKAKALIADITTKDDDHAFAAGIRGSVHDMLCSDTPGAYRGLDSDRDTEQEVETILRIVPEVLKRRTAGFYPITLQTLYDIRFENADASDVRFDDHHQLCNVKAVSFIPIMAKVAIEFDLFYKDERGGLLCENEEEIEHHDVLTTLVGSSTAKEYSNDADHHQLVDRRFLGVLVRLKEMGLLKKEDIMHTNRNLLIYCLPDKETLPFPEQRFRFLSEWNPGALVGKHGDSPLYHAAECLSITNFRLVLEAGIRLLSKTKGINILFRKKYNDTPFKLACKEYGKEEVMRVIETALNDCHSNDNTPFDTKVALLLAATDIWIDLEGSYFWLRRDPGVLQKLLPKTVDSHGGDNNGSQDGRGKRKRGSKKRKRNRH